MTKKPENKLTQSDIMAEIQKLDPLLIEEYIEYVPKKIVSKTIIKKITGNVVATSFDAGEELEGIVSRFDTFIQIIHGQAELTINDKKYQLRLGEGILIPAHVKHSYNAQKQFKMIATVIKSGYED